MIARKRRTQAERTAETRKALIDAAIVVMNRVGYSAATTALISEEAGVSRGAILHHFGTRVELMVEVVRSVYEQEVADYARLLERMPAKGAKASEWPEVMWSVLSRPSGVAVLEILQGSRSDPVLAEQVKPMQAQIEQNALAGMHAQFGGDPKAVLATMRLLVWAARGLSIAQTLVDDPAEITRSVTMLRRIAEAAEDAGVLFGKGAGPRDAKAAPASATKA